MRLVRLLFSCVAVVLTSLNANGADRIALVIGNSNYQHLGTLINTKNDANEIGRALSDLGFSSKVILDASEQKLRRELRSFSALSEGANIALVFYAGHGAQVAGENYILPVDMEIPTREADIQLSAIKTDDVIGSIKSSVKVVFLDACRDNPVVAKNLSKGRGASFARGLAPIRASQFIDDRQAGGIFIAFATEAGNTASDGNKEHSPFTDALIRHIRKPISIDDMFSLVTRDVRQATNNSQRPYKYASLEQIVCLPPGCSAGGNDLQTKSGASDGPKSESLVSESNRKYEAALAASDRDELERIVRKFPNTTAAELASAAILKLKKLYPDDWVYVGSTGEKESPNRFYYLPSSLRTGNGRTWVSLKETKGQQKPKDFQITKTVFDCQRKLWQIAQVDTFDNSGRVVLGPLFGDPRVINMTAEITEGSINHSLAGLVCPPANPGRILTEDDVKSENWKMIATYDDNVSTLQLFNDSIETVGGEVRAIIKYENRVASKVETQRGYEGPTPVVTVGRIAANCKSGEFSMLDSDFLGPNGTLIEKLFATGRGNWVAPTKGSPLELGVRVLCLATDSGVKP